jgi:3-oxoadipate enol-lactonase
MTALAHEVAGSGPTLLLVHAGIADRRMWDDQVGPFAAAGWRVVAADLPGFGETPRPDGPVALWATLRDLLARLGVDRAVVVGCSLGGRAAVDLAVAAPERVRALVLVGSSLAGRRFQEPALFELWDRGEARSSAATSGRRPGWRSTPGWPAWTALPRRSARRCAGGSPRCS